MSNLTEHNPEQAGVTNNLGISVPKTRLGGYLEVLFWLGFTVLTGVALALVAWLLFGQR